MTENVTLVDYGCGNILSITRALEDCGAKVSLSQDPDSILKADRLVLPGVGAFGHCVEMIKQRQLFEPLLAYISSQKPVLGICVGMQMLLTESQEYGHHMGADIIPGKVVKILSADNQKRVPSVGWAKVEMKSSNSSLDKINNEWFYFVHSYVARPNNPEYVLGEYHYFDERITALIAKDNVIGCQFHPEKSGQAGLHFFSEFLKL